MNEKGFVSVIVPCRDEEEFIEPCLDSIIANDYSKERLEVIVVDGMSQDRTRQIVESYVARHPCVKILTNPKKITSSALNLGILQSRGDVIIWMSAHNTYEPSYISKCVEALQSSDADNVGGAIVTMSRRPTLIGRAIVACLGHSFGVGNAYFRTRPSKPMWVDTVFGGCYRREVFNKIGLFNERLVRGQDLELNLRLKKAGGRILLLPQITSYYYARSTFSSFCRHNFINGMWAILPFSHSSVMPVSWRHMIPLLFVASLLTSAAASWITPLGKVFFLSISACYALANFLSSIHVAKRERDPRLLLLMPLVFASLHISYGLGSFFGLIRLACSASRTSSAVLESK